VAFPSSKETRFLHHYTDLIHKQGIASLLWHLGELARQQGDYAAARARHEEALTMQRELGDKQGSAYSLKGLGELVREQGDYAAARALLEESLAIWRELGNKRGIADLLLSLGDLTRQEGDYAAAHAHYDECLALDQELGVKGGAVLGALGDLAADEGDYGEARRLWGVSLSECQQVGNRRGVPECLEGFAYVSLRQGQAERAARLLGAAQGLRDAVGASVRLRTRTDYEHTLSGTRAALGEGVFALAWAEARAMTLEQAVAYALEETKGSVEASVQQCVVPPEDVASPTCPCCSSSEHQIKAGFNRGGSQRYQCQRCHRIYTPKKTSQGYSEEIRLEALRLSDQGQSVRRIAELLGVAPQSVANWIKAHQTDLPAR
jgi:tetratricopeptide (TPR) repeat protein